MNEERDAFMPARAGLLEGLERLAGGEGHHRGVALEPRVEARAPPSPA
ncbi:MAG: hypothetical protein H6730_00890 [Deltaproteobacteria bacterium]|nr:hypothetical protein [Deltaproteobacteria bacterium]